MDKIKLTGVFAGALLLSTSIATAQEVPAVVAEPVPVEAPVAVPVEAPVVQAPAPVITAVPEPAAAPKPAETVSATIAGTKISLYGRLELNAAYENDVTDGLWSWRAPAAAKGDAEDRFSIGVARTRLGFNLEGPSKENEPALKGRFEADFAGNSNYNNFGGGGADATSTSTSTSTSVYNGTDPDDPRASISTTTNTTTSTSVSSAFRIRQAWGSVNFKDIGLTLLFGQTDDVVNPLDPPSVNSSSLNGSGNLGNRRPQIRITEAIGPVELAVAALHDRSYGYTARKDAEDASKSTWAVSDANAPSSLAFQGRLGVKLPAVWAGEKANVAVGISGLYAASEAASNDTARYAAPEPSRMFGADLALPVIDILTLTGEFFTGQNLSRYGDGSLKLSRAYGSQKSKDGNSFKDFGGIQSIGWWGGLSAKLPASLSLGLGIGAESLDEDSKTAGAATCATPDDKKNGCLGNIESNMFTFANLAYNFTSAAKVTFEWLLFSTDYSKGKYEDKGNTDDSGKKIYNLAIKDNGRPEFDGSYGRSLNRFELNFRYDFK